MRVTASPDRVYLEYRERGDLGKRKRSSYTSTEREYVIKIEKSTKIVEIRTITTTNSKEVHAFFAFLKIPFVFVDQLNICC